jgi:formylglycine-generating enzyme
MNMQKNMLVIICIGMGIALANGWADPPVIESMNQNGTITWSSDESMPAYFRVEWASSLDGPWYRSFQRQAVIDHHASGQYTIEVPMFYRVVQESEPAPQGMAWIEPGTFTMGSPYLDYNVDTKPDHAVQVSGFWMDVTEVPAWKWNQVYDWATNQGYQFSSAVSTLRPDAPIAAVNWYDAIKWCNARSEMEGLAPIYYANLFMTDVYKTGEFDLMWINWTNQGYRLPTEAEWEKAARGGYTERHFPWGTDTITHDQANYFSDGVPSYDISPTSGNHPYYDGARAPVASFHPNAFGLFDMAGNVNEWCWDWYDAAYYSSSPATDPRGPDTGTERVVRSGGYLTAAAAARVAHRQKSVPAGSALSLGFRCVRGP